MDFDQQNSKHSSLSISRGTTFQAKSENRLRTIGLQQSGSIIYAMILLIGCLLCSACSNGNTPAQTSATPTSSRIASPTATLPPLNADSGWHIVAQDHGTHEDQSTITHTLGTFAFKKSVIVLATCQGNGTLSVDISAVESSSFPCTSTPQPYRDQSTQSSIQTASVTVTAKGSITWNILIEDS